MRHLATTLCAIFFFCFAVTFNNAAYAATAKGTKPWHVKPAVAKLGSLKFFKAIINSPDAKTTINVRLPAGGVKIIVEGSDIDEYVLVESIRITRKGPRPFFSGHRIAYKGKYRLTYVTDKPTLDWGPFSYEDLCENSGVRHLEAWITSETTIVINNDKAGNEEELVLQVKIRDAIMEWLLKRSGKKAPKK